RFLKKLDGSAIKVERYNLSQEPAAYTTGIIAETLKEKGTAALPLVMIDHEIISMGEYPDLEKLSGLLGINEVSWDMPDCSGCSGCG
ncbi:MAG TPA: arsenic metallochaperone ArsD family protein, partial [Pontiella sp.]|nr:arsenic metallochaperone ArsD family protein [Pontiella sp.]